MRRRTLYLIAFLVLGAAAALLTLRMQQTVSIVVATHDLRAGVEVRAADVELRSMHEDVVPAGALSGTDEAVGRFVAWPLTAGEAVLGRQLRVQRSGGAVTGGVDVPAGYRAVAVPVQPAGAVGGMLVPGDRVDVFATPLAGHGPLLAAQPAQGGGDLTSPAPSQAVLLGRDVLVLQLRSDQGQGVDTAASDSVHGLNFGAGKLGSVVLAVPQSDVAAYAAAASNASMFLALSVG